MLDAVDLFAGPGGWDVAAEALGLKVKGVEFEHWACETRRAAGLDTVEGDVTAYGPADFPSRGLIGSPPCQTFSMAGKGAGRKALSEVLTMVAEMGAGRKFDAGHWSGDPRTVLVLEPLRWAIEAIELGTPYRWIVLEQVPQVLPVWQAMAEVLRGAGYSVATGNLQAEQYGVPQTRKRAVLIASLDGPAALPAPTHSRYHARDKSRLDPGVLPWVSIGEVVNLPDPEGWRLRSNYGTGGDPAARGERGSDEPAATVTSKVDRNLWVRFGNQENSAVRSTDEPAATIRYGQRMNACDWVYVSSTMANASRRNGDEPAPTVAFGHDANSVRWLFAGAGATSQNTAGQVPRPTGDPAHTVTGKGTAAWLLDGPAPAINGDPRIDPRGCEHPGPGCCSNYPGSPQPQFGAGSVRVSVEEAAALQSFPPWYPWQGTKTRQYQQVGNAVPPLLALAVLSSVLLTD